MKYRTHRYPTRFAVKLVVGAVSTPATITSISASGAGVQVDIHLAVGQSVTLTCFGSRIVGTVRWVGPEKAGIAFQRMLGKSELDRIRYGVRSAMQASSHRRNFMEMR